MPALYVGCADNIAHADKTAMGAFENPSAWRVPLAAFRYRACLAGKFFVHIVENGDTFGLGFVADIFTHSATPSSPAPRPPRRVPGPVPSGGRTAQCRALHRYAGVTTHPVPNVLGRECVRHRVKPSTERPVITMQSARDCANTDPVRSVLGELGRETGSVPSHPVQSLYWTVRTDWTWCASRCSPHVTALHFAEPPPSGLRPAGVLTRSRHDLVTHPVPKVLGRECIHPVTAYCRACRVRQHRDTRQVSRCSLHVTAYCRTRQVSRCSLHVTV